MTPNHRPGNHPAANNRLSDRLSDLLVDWEQSQRDGRATTLEELCKDAPDLLPAVRESVDSLKATRWMLEAEPSESVADERWSAESRADLHDTELPASHLTVEQFAASIFQSGLLSPAEIADLNRQLTDSPLPGEVREIASRLVKDGKLTRYQASVLLKASNDPLLIDNYVILDTLDTGGMGLVFKALHRSMNRVVALKLLPAAMMSARDTVKRFQREVQAAASLQHPNVVAAYDADESAEVAYLVLEYVEGTNLFRLVKEQGPLPVAVAANYVRQAATGLAYLHSRGIIHRDVKPANLILAQDGTVKLLDMGLVRFASSEDLSCVDMDQELTQAGIVIGTVAYMSPEQALDTRSADQRSDIYSLGCTLFFLLTGRSLYHEETGMKTLLAHREQAVPSIREFCEDAPVSLDAVFRTMVSKRPADRLQTMTEVIAALDACVPGLAKNAAGAPVAGSASRRLASLARPAAWKSGRAAKTWRSRPLWIGLVIAAVAGLAAGGTYLAGILIRIKSNQGTTEVHVDDPNATVTMIPDVAGSTVGPRPNQRFGRRFPRNPGWKPQAKSGATLEQQMEMARPFARNPARDPIGLTPDQIDLARSSPRSGQPNARSSVSEPMSVDRLVAGWVLNQRGARLWLQGRPRSPIEFGRWESLPSGEFHVEGIAFPNHEPPAPTGGRLSFQTIDIERLASLSELKWLALPFPTITDDVVIRLKTLTKLTRLTLPRTNISDACLSSLAGMTRLSWLDLRQNANITDTGLLQLAALKSLNELHRPSANLETKVSIGWQIASEPPYPTLLLDNTRTTEAGLLQLQQALPNCHIFASQIYPGDVIPRLSLPPRTGASDREWAIWLLSNNVFDGRIFADVDPETAITSIEKLPPIDFHIQSLSFSSQVPHGGVFPLTSFLFRRLGDLPNLRTLEVAHLPANAFPGLTALKSLQTLTVHEADATDDTLTSLAAIPALTALHLNAKQITDAGLKSLAPLKTLRALDLSGQANGLHGSGFEFLKGSALRELSLTGSGIDDAGCGQIGQLINLETLGLRDTWISGKGLKALEGLKHLKFLDLARCRRLQDSDLTALVQFPALEQLDLSECRLTDAALGTLKKLTTLRSLTLNHTHLTVTAMHDLIKALPKVQIDWTQDRQQG